MVPQEDWQDEPGFVEPWTGSVRVRAAWSTTAFTEPAWASSPDQSWVDWWARGTSGVASSAWVSTPDAGVWPLAGGYAARLMQVRVTHPTLGDVQAATPSTMVLAVDVGTRGVTAGGEDPPPGFRLERDGGLVTALAAEFGLVGYVGGSWTTPPTRCVLARPPAGMPPESAANADPRAAGWPRSGWVDLLASDDGRDPAVDATAVSTSVAVVAGVGLVSPLPGPAAGDPFGALPVAGSGQVSGEVEVLVPWMRDVTVTRGPWRWRWVREQHGAWRLRQRQSPAGADGWPLRQRQSGGHSGTWPLRQRQRGI